MSLKPLFLILLLAMTGCQLSGRKQEVVSVKPVLPETIGREELVEFLNGKTDGLKSWRCTNTQVHVKSRDLPFPQKLKGTLACSAPGQFRLVCDNTMGHADFGSNEQICWAYVKPGESIVMTWKHEDSALLQYLPGGLPRLEPEWLMTVLGIEPLHAERYELQNAPLGSKEVWLVAVEDAPDGSSLRRVIKVDTVRGVVRRHALYDSDAKPLLIADLSDYKACKGHELPHTVHIEFPANETELTLKFHDIQTQCSIPDTLWHPPHGRNIEVVDLGDTMRRRIQHDPDMAHLRNLGVVKPPGKQTVFNDRQEAQWDGQIPNVVSDSRPKVPGISFAGNSEEVSQIDDRFYGAASGQDSFENSGENQGASEEEFDRAIAEESGAPEFDIVAPSPPVRKRSRWFPFGRR